MYNILFRVALFSRASPTAKIVGAKIVGAKIVGAKIVGVQTCKILINLEARRSANPRYLRTKSVEVDFMSLRKED